MRYLLVVFAVLIFAAPAAAQRDFLTVDEADQLRLAQEPEPRLQLYLKFAQQRLDLLGQLFADSKAGRSGMIHTTLEQFTEIIDAIDAVIDDTLRKRRELETVEFVAKTEREMLASLEKFGELNPPDAGRYRFALEQAIETLRDSIEMAEEDLRERRLDVETREAEARKKRDAMMTPAQLEEMKKERELQAAEEEKKKKGPTLLRKGETLPKKGGK